MADYNDYLEYLHHIDDTTAQEFKKKEDELRHQMDVVRDQCQKDIRNLKEATEAEKAKLEADHQSAIDKLVAEHNVSIEALNSKAIQQEAAHKAELESLTNGHKSSLEAKLAAAEEMRKSEVLQLTKTIELLKSSSQEEINDLKNQIASNPEYAKKYHTVFLELEENKKKYEEELCKLRQEREQEQRDLSIKYKSLLLQKDEELSALADKHDKELNELRQNHTKEKEEINQRLHEKISEAKNTSPTQEEKNQEIESSKKNESKNRFPKKILWMTLGCILVLAIIFTDYITNGLFTHFGNVQSNEYLTVDTAAVVENTTIVLTKGHASKRNFVYTGEVDADGLPNGHGRANYPETQSSEACTFEGSFNHGITSEGVMKFDNGNQFDGTFTDDGFYEEGTWTETDGYYFVGTFKNGDPYNGTWYTPQGNVESKVTNGK